MDRAARPFARFTVDHLVRDAGLPRKPTIGRSGITDQQDIGRVRLNQKVLVQIDQFPDTVFEAKVTFIYPSMNRNDQTFCVEAKFDRRSPYLFIHTPVEANIIVEERQDVLVVPKEALAGKDSLWIKDKKRYRKVFVKTGVSSFDYVEVVAGVNEKNLVILDWYKLN